MRGLTPQTLNNPERNNGTSVEQWFTLMSVMNEGGEVPPPLALLKHVNSVLARGSINDLLTP